MSDQDVQINGNLRYLIRHVVKTISLPDFMESETGCDLKWSQQDVSAKCCCPLHDENIPSFCLDLKENGVWVFYCWGCGAKGNILHFCKDLHGLRNLLESVNYICKKYKIQNTDDLILEGIKSVKVTINKQRKLENANILASNQCRMLLRRDFKKHQRWVLETFKRLNHALAQGDYEEVERIGYEAAKRMHIKEKK